MKIACLSRFARLLWLFLATSTVCATGLRAQDTPSSQQVRTEKQAGLTVTTFVAPQGSVKVYLPDDMAPGDTISGIVLTEPAGPSGVEREQNAVALNLMVVQFGSQRWRVATGAVHKLLISRDVTNTELALADGNGAAVGRTQLNLAVEHSQPAPSAIVLPRIGQTGRLVVIHGPFDGDMSNTRVRVGEVDATVLAESPRRVVIRSPHNVVGVTPIEVTEASRTSQGQFRNVGVNLSAPRTSLQRGESTQLSVQVTGLEGLTQPIAITLENLSPSVVSLGGGNTQTLTVDPSSSSQATFTSTLTGMTSGGFNLTATVLADLPPSSLAETGAPTSPSTPNVPAPLPATGGADPPRTQTVGFSAAELKNRCDELRLRLREVKGPCERKTMECLELERRLSAAQTAAQQAQQDRDRKKIEFDEAMQTLLNNLTAAARAKGFDTKLSLRKESANYVPLELAKGVVIYFDASGIEGQRYIDNLADALRGMIAGSLIRQLRQMAASLAEGDKKNADAQAALATARAALEKCRGERDALCAKVKEIEAELAKCERDATAQAEVEQKSREKQEADKRAADQARILADEAERKKQAEAKRAEAQALKEASERERLARERAKRQKLETTCLKFFVNQAVAQANLNAEQKNAFEQLMGSMDELGSGLQNAQTAAELIPALSHLSDALGKVNASKDVIDRVRTAIDQCSNWRAVGAGRPKWEPRCS